MNTYFVSATASASERSRRDSAPGVPCRMREKKQNTAECTLDSQRWLVGISSVQEGIYAFRKANIMSSTSYLRHFFNVAVEMVPVFI